MLTNICPKLPMRNKAQTIDFYINKLGFEQFGGDFPDYLMIKKDAIEIHFFVHIGLNPKENDGQVYIRTNAIDTLFQQWVMDKVSIHPNGHLAIKPWGTKEFSLLDPDHNLLTFGQVL
jgi:hypothetical protein